MYTEVFGFHREAVTGAVGDHPGTLSAAWGRLSDSRLALVSVEEKLGIHRSGCFYKVLSFSPSNDPFQKR